MTNKNSKLNLQEQNFGYFKIRAQSFRRKPVLILHFAM